MFCRAAKLTMNPLIYHLKRSLVVRNNKRKMCGGAGLQGHPNMLIN
jgi:hypothetical protein